MPSWLTAQNLVVFALLWLVIEGCIGFIRYRSSNRKNWGWWLLVNTLSAVMLLLAALALVNTDSVIPFALCMMGAFLAHLLELKFRPDKTEH